MTKLVKIALLLNVLLSVLLEHAGNTDSAIYLMIMCIFIVQIEKIK